MTWNPQLCCWEKEESTERQKLSSQNNSKAISAGCALKSHISMEMDTMVTTMFWDSWLQHGQDSNVQSFLDIPEYSTMHLKTRTTKASTCCFWKAMQWSTFLLECSSPALASHLLVRIARNHMLAEFYFNSSSCSLPLTYDLSKSTDWTKPWQTWSRGKKASSSLRAAMTRILRETLALRLHPDF